MLLPACSRGFHGCCFIIAACTGTRTIFPPAACSSLLTLPAQVNDADVASVKNAIEVSLAAFAKPATAVRPKLTVQGISEDRQELLHTLMDTYVKNDVLSIQQSIVNRKQSRAAGLCGTYGHS